MKRGTNIASKEEVAVKICNRKTMDKDDEVAINDEVAILRAINHPNITRLIDFFVEKENFYVVLELLDGGELFDRIVKKSFYNEKEARDLVLVLLNTIKHLHDKNIVHRDLKPENLLLKSQTNDLEIKLADFGFAIVCEGDNITSQCGTPGYIAPEILEARPYGKPADMWSFGVILYILLGGYQPFYHSNQRALFRKIIKAEYTFHPEYWKGVSDEAKDLIACLLVKDTKKRLTVDQALQHKWLAKSETDLEATSLNENLDQLRKYLATRRFKKCVKAVIAVDRMKRLVGDIKRASLSADTDRLEEDAGEGEDDATYRDLLRAASTTGELVDNATSDKNFLETAYPTTVAEDEDDDADALRAPDATN